jgi:hydrogenase expression/formation protein HypE
VDFITLAHGSGGRMTHNLINDIFRKYFANDILEKGDDSANIKMQGSRIAFTTDSFVISPIFFKGGNIGKIAVCGTVNDLTAAGAKPLYLSCGFIIEEGLSFEDLERIARSMGETAASCGVRIVTGDTKVVQKGAADKIFINTSGIGLLHDDTNISGSNAMVGDKIIVTGNIGDHGCSIMLEREQLNINADIKSDCAPLNGLIKKAFDVTKDIHVLRDPTRGGLATTLNEIATQSNVGITLYEDKIPVDRQVSGVCELLGMDPLYMANEGKMIIIVPAPLADSVLGALRSDPLGGNSSIIGEVTDGKAGRVIMKTFAGGSRILDMLTGDQLPRIC